MEQERYSVLFSSQTGNTKILAQAIAQAPAGGGHEHNALTSAVYLAE